MQLIIPPRWESAVEAWAPCSKYFSDAGWDEDDTYGLAMAAQELLENAVKYGVFGPDDAITLNLDSVGDTGTVEVVSRVKADSDRFRKLDQTIQWIRGFQNPFEAWVERLKDVSSRPLVSGESGLGLTRIAYEGGCILDFYVSEDNLLAISAVLHRPRRPKSLEPSQNHH